MERGRFAFAVVLALTVSGCSAEPPESNPPSASPSPLSGGTSEATSSGSPAAGVPSLCAGAGETTSLLVDVAGRAREALVQVSAGASPQPMPIVLVFHGYGDTAASVEDMTAISTKADSSGFVAVYPMALGDRAKWDVAGDTDITFVDALLDRLSQEGCIDPERVFATGMSMGAAWPTRLAVGWIA